jgi:hypothetical protein
MGLHCYKSPEVPREGWLEEDCLGMDYGLLCTRVTAEF